MGPPSKILVQSQRLCSSGVITWSGEYVSPYIPTPTAGEDYRVHLQSPGWQPILSVALVICKQRKEYGHIWHRISLLRPGAIKQHKHKDFMYLDWIWSWIGVSQNSHKQLWVDLWGLLSSRDDPKLFCALLLFSYWTWCDIKSIILIDLNSEVVIYIIFISLTCHLYFFWIKWMT